MRPVFVNSLPKAGTNLVAKALTLMGYREIGHISAGSVFDSAVRARFRRMLWGQDVRSGYSIGIMHPVSVRRWPIDWQLGRLHDGAFITAHIGESRTLLNEIIARRIVPLQVLRDPRAVLASFVPYVLQDKAHFLHARFSNMDCEQRYLSVLEGISENGITLLPMRVYCESLSSWIENDRVLKLRFEDLVGSKGGGNDERQIETLMEVASLLHIPTVSLERTAQELFGPGRHTFRSGRIDGWKYELPDHIIDRVSIELEPILRCWGYD